MVNEKIVVGEGTEYPLHGMLTLPDDTAEKWSMKANLGRNWYTTTFLHYGGIGATILR